eukprot:UN0947
MKRFPFARLIRVNPENPGVPKEWVDRAISLPLSATEALQQLDELVGNVELVRFIVHDCWGGGKEMDLPRDIPVHKILRRSLPGLYHGDPGFIFHEGEEFKFCGVHILNREVCKELHPLEQVPFELLVNVDGDDKPMACVLQFNGGHYDHRNKALEARMGRIYYLCVELHQAFAREYYQERLKGVADRDELRALIREVHLEVLPRHGIEVSEEFTSGQWLIAQQRMQAFIMSGDWWSELLTLSSTLQAASGVDRIASLPAKFAKAKSRSKAVQK